MMEQIGYSLINADNKEVQFWGETPGRFEPIPKLIRLPNGDDVHCPSVGIVGDFKLVPRYVSYGSEQSVTIDSSSVVVNILLERLKSTLKNRVDSDAEAVRMRYITPGDGMQQTYREKFEQASAVNAMGQDAANALTEVQRNASFPVLAASVGIEAATLWDCAQLVLQRFAQWAQIARLIETKRLAGKKAISEASDAAAAQAAYEAITWTDLP